jgi:putative serine protease PepD
MTAVEGDRVAGAPNDDPAGQAPPPSDDAAGRAPAASDDAAGRAPAASDDPAGQAPPPSDDPAGQVPPQSDDPAGQVPAASDEPAGRPPPPALPAAAPRRWWRSRRLLAAAVLVLVGGLVGGVAGASTVLALRPAVDAAAPVATPADLADVVAAVAPAVLRIQAGAPDTGTAGTAVVLTPTGDVVTNEHLVRGETTATLITGDGRRSTARVVATDEKADLAWLRVDGAADLPVARLAAPGAVRLGDDVVAIGNALNLDGAPSITRGVVSAMGRSTETMQDLMQTDAAISSGSSGGALVDETGAVVGITTEALVGDPSVSVEDIAFAIPSERVAAVLGGMGLVLPPAG